MLRNFLCGRRDSLPWYRISVPTATCRLIAEILFWLSFVEFRPSWGHRRIVYLFIFREFWNSKTEHFRNIRLPRNIYCTESKRFLSQTRVNEIDELSTKRQGEINKPAANDFWIELCCDKSLASSHAWISRNQTTQRSRKMSIKITTYTWIYTHLLFKSKQLRYFNDCHGWHGDCEGRFIAYLEYVHS